MLNSLARDKVMTRYAVIPSCLCLLHKLIGLQPKPKAVPTKSRKRCKINDYNTAYNNGGQVAWRTETKSSVQCHPLVPSSLSENSTSHPFPPSYPGITKPTGPPKVNLVPVNVMPLAGGQVVSALLIFKREAGRKKGIMGQRDRKSVG